MIVTIFLWAELLHYIVGAVGCAFMSQEIPANYFPDNVRDCEGARYIVSGVLAPFYITTALSILQTIRDRTNMRRLCIRMCVFFLALMLSDTLSLMNEWEYWTVNKIADASIHLFLAFISYYILSTESNENEKDEMKKKNKKRKDEECIQKKDV